MSTVRVGVIFRGDAGSFFFGMAELAAIVFAWTGFVRTGSVFRALAGGVRAPAEVISARFAVTAFFLATAGGLVASRTVFVVFGLGGRGGASAADFSTGCGFTVCLPAGAIGSAFSAVFARFGPSAFLGLAAISGLTPVSVFLTAGDTAARGFEAAERLPGGPGPSSIEITGKGAGGSPKPAISAATAPT